MSDTTFHERCVDAWLDTHARGANNARMPDLLLIGLRAIWQRAQPSLGDVTLAAIVRRAAHTAERQHESLAQLGLRVTDRGEIELTNPSAPRVDLRDAVRSLLVEVLQVLAGLTGGALTHALHAALSSAADESGAFVLLGSATDHRDGRGERGTP